MRISRLAPALIAVTMLAGCAGLNVSWSLVATYKTPHATPGAPVPAATPEK